jgi:phosphoribosylformylglycinamidine synthase
MAANAIDEAIRNCVAVGADPARIGILDNFCWGRTDRPETLGSLVRAALACRDLSIELQTPFISGKDSLHNEFRYTDSDGELRTIAIPGTLLISALGQIDDVRRCVTMDFKKPGSAIYLIGSTGFHLGGSHLSMVADLSGGRVPTVNPAVARQTLKKLHEAISASLVRSCHDLSEGGLAVALAEMAIAGDLGATLDIGGMPIHDATLAPSIIDTVRLFSESNSRFVVEVDVACEQAFVSKLQGVALVRLGEVTDSGALVFRNGKRTLVQASIPELRRAWQSPLDWS